MTARPEPHGSGIGAAAERTPRLTIGEVLAVLRDEFPDVTISKLRYLETEDLVHPQRTPSGYRKFSAADVERLRFVLAAQRDRYLPLRVIKAQLEALDRGEPLPPAGETPPAVAGDPQGRRTGGSGGGAGPAEPAGQLAAADFARHAGLGEEQLADCVQFGLLVPDEEGRLAAADLPVARAAAGLARHGIEPRHLRVHLSGVEREAGLVEQLVAPVLRARSEDARARAADKLRDLAGLSAQLHAALLDSRLRDLLGD